MAGSRKKQLSLLLGIASLIAALSSCQEARNNAPPGTAHVSLRTPLVRGVLNGAQGDVPGVGMFFCKDGSGAFPSVGTATLIDPNLSQDPGVKLSGVESQYLLTAAHVTDCYLKGGLYAGLRFGTDNDHATAWIDVIGAVTTDQWKAGGWGDVFGGDIAVVKIAQPVSGAHGLFTGTLSPGTPITRSGIGHYDASDTAGTMHTGTMYFDSYFAAGGVANGAMRTIKGNGLNAGCKGDSGSSVVWDGLVVGVMSQSSWNGSPDYNCANVVSNIDVTVKAYYSFIQSAIQQLGGVSAPQASWHGAIAVSWSTGKIGASWRGATLQDSIDAAVNSCGGGDCQAIVKLDNNQCGAYAWGNGGSGWSWGYDTAAAAESGALAQCASRASACSIGMAICADRGQDMSAPPPPASSPVYWAAMARATNGNLCRTPPSTFTSQQAAINQVLSWCGGGATLVGSTTQCMAFNWGTMDAWGWDYSSEQAASQGNQDYCSQRGQSCPNTYGICATSW